MVRTRSANFRRAMAPRVSRLSSESGLLCVGIWMWFARSFSLEAEALQSRSCVRPVTTAQSNDGLFQRVATQALAIRLKPLLVSRSRKRPRMT